MFLLLAKTFGEKIAILRNGKIKGNFNRDEIGNVVRFCHKLKPPKKAYLTTNILIYDNELEDLENLKI